MQLRREALLVVILGLLTAQGCGASSQAPAENAAATAETASAPSAKSSRPPEKPSAEQIARWAVPEFEPLTLLACSDGFDDHAVLSMAVGPDGKQFVLGGAKLTLWNTKDSKPAVDLIEGYEEEKVKRPIRSVAISSDGKWIVAGDQEGKVLVWTTADHREVGAFQAHDAHITQLAISPNSNLLATTSYSGDVNLWELPEGKQLKSLKMDEQEIRHLAFLSDTLLAAAGSEASIWNIETGAKVAALTKEHVIGPALGVTSDRGLLAFNDPDATVHFWDAQDSKLTDVALRGAGAGLIAFSHDGKWIATYSSESTIDIWDAATGSAVQVIDADGGRTSALTWLPDSNSLLVASEQGRVRIWGGPKAAEAIGITPIELPALESIAEGAHKSMSSAQLQRVIDIRSFPRLLGAVPHGNDFGMSAYVARATQQEAEQFYRHFLEKAGWTEAEHSAASLPGLTFRKDGCELHISIAPAADYGIGGAGELQIGLQFEGNYDVGWLPKIAPVDSKSQWGSFSSVSYRSTADLTVAEVVLLKQFHEAGWTAYTRLAASSLEVPDSRTISLLQGGSVLIASMGHPADSTQQLAIQMGVNVTTKSLPIPPDAGWIEFDASSDLQMVANTKMDLKQTADFYDARMAADGWLAREAGRHFKDDKAWLPYIRGQQDVLLFLEKLPGGGTRIVVGEAARSSWQLQEPAKDSEATTKPGIEAADFKLPAGAASVKFDVDQKRIDFEVAAATPTTLGEQFVKQMESLEWEREDRGVLSDEYVYITFTKDDVDIEFRARGEAGKATAILMGDGLLWDKPLPTAPVRVSYGTWLRRNHFDATLQRLDEFAAEMKKIPAGKGE